MAKSETLGAFLLQLVMSDERRDTFMNATDADKKKIMIKFGLGHDEYDAVLSGDLAGILDVLNDGVRAEARRLLGTALVRT